MAKSLLEAAFGENASIEVAESGAEALTVFADSLEEGGDVAVVMADYLMPGMRGDELLTCIYQRSPATLKIMLTRQADWAGVVMGLTR
ncbi:MAG: hypothetical protein RID09_21775 [Coleofasciculus sp. G1-WW12-02]|uniref:hypothetical protein n=1 Tax=Coleofasciculus sp. G1-WW12-02 TaxID=3068483 RepID=UPI003302533C